MAQKQLTGSIPINNAASPVLATKSPYGKEVRSIQDKLADRARVNSVPNETPKEDYYPRYTNDTKKEQDKLYNILDQEEPDLNKIRNDLTKNNQGVIDAISASYANTIDQERQRGEVLNRRGRAVNVNSGLSGSDFASSNAQGIEDENNKAVQSIQRERDAKIQAVLNNVAMTATNMYQEQRDKYRQSAQDKLDRIKEFKQTAMGDVEEFAKSGISSAKLKQESPETWDNLLKQTGYSESALSALFASKMPQASKVFEEKVGNKVILGYRDPTTGAITKEEVQLPADYKELKIIDNKPYFVDIESGKIIPAEGYVPTPKTTKAKVVKDGEIRADGTVKIGRLVTTPDQLALTDAWLNEATDREHFAQRYQKSLTKFIASGATPQEFAKRFPKSAYPYGGASSTKSDSSDDSDSLF